MKILNLALLLLLGCAHGPKKEPPLHNTAAVIDLGRNAYIKGCVDGVKKKYPKARDIFAMCRDLGIIYQNDLNEMLKGEEDESSSR